MSDKAGLIEILQERKTRSLKKLWGDSAYQGQELSTICKRYGIDLEIVKRPPGRRRIYNEHWRAEWLPIERGFSVLPRRWVVERTYAWMGRHRRLSKDYEFLPTTSESYLYLAMADVLLRRLKN